MGAFAGTPYSVVLQIDGTEDREDPGGPWSSRCHCKREVEGKEAVPSHPFLPDVAGSWNGVTGRDSRKGHSRSKLGMSLSLLSPVHAFLKSLLQTFAELCRSKDAPMGHMGAHCVLRQQHPLLGTGVNHGAGR